MTPVECETDNLFPKIQFGINKPGGSELAANLIKNCYEILSDENNSEACDTVILKTDFANAFNCISRKKVMETIMENNKINSIKKFFYWSYSFESPLLICNANGEIIEIIKSSQGVKQGDPLASFAFALTVQQLYEETIKDLDLKAVAILDDLTLIGKISEVEKALNKLNENSKSFGLHLRLDKCGIYSRNQLSPSAEIIKNRMNNIGIPSCEKIETLGSCIGNKEQLKNWCLQKVENQKYFLTKFYIQL